jgi:hypothetical protein
VKAIEQAQAATAKQMEKAREEERAAIDKVVFIHARNVIA